MTTTASLVFKAAHVAANLADKVVAYRTRFSTALRAAWAAAKQLVKATMETPSEIVIKVGIANVTVSASNGQYNALLGLGAKGLGLQLNASQFSKRVDMATASEAISALKAGQQVRFEKITY